MWVMLNDAFFSIVDKDCKRDELMVRARRPGDIEKVFGTLQQLQVTEYTASDYHYRAAVKRDVVGQALIGELARVTYNNFKNSVEDHDLHAAYNKVWHAMAALQPQRPYAGDRRSLPLLDFGQEPERPAIAPAKKIKGIPKAKKK